MVLLPRVLVVREMDIEPEQEVEVEGCSSKNLEYEEYNHQTMKAHFTYFGKLTAMEKMTMKTTHPKRLP